ncbi:MAG: TerC family protein [Planctomycetales bacterium]|nr:TerC family protein [Planctomycetales bacterium]
MGEFSVEYAIQLLALTLMEIVLGIDNIVFITIVSSRLPVEQRPLGRRLGLGLALLFRILLLLMLYYVVNNLVAPFMTLEGTFGITQELLNLDEHSWKEMNEVSWRDVILIGGGLFLVAKSVHEIHQEVEHDADQHQLPKKFSMSSVLIQIGLLDIVFSLDSVITAVGMVDDLKVMVAAIVVAVFAMIVFANKIGDFVEENPTLKMLALSFLILIGVMLVAEGVGTHIDKGYIYFAMAFAIIVEFLNMRLRKKSQAATA